MSAKRPDIKPGHTANERDREALEPNERLVSVARAECLRYERDYQGTPPFDPHFDYPEYPFSTTNPEANLAYSSVREAFRIAGLDRLNYGSDRWNPLRSLISPGQLVLLKPNLVKELHPRDAAGWRYVLTHGSIIRAVADYVAKALQGKGCIIVADAPQTDSSFQEIAGLLGLYELRQFYRDRGITFEVCDLRKQEWESRGGVVVARRDLSGDPHGYVAFDLADGSEFADHHGSGRYYGAGYDAAEVNRHHSGGRHEYLVAGTPIQADVIFSLPKLKTHKKAGITASLKNLVGINGDKNWLPHHTEGTPETGGDERPYSDTMSRVERSSLKYLRQLSLNVPGLGPWAHRQARRLGSVLFGATGEVVRSGNWWGNDTTWRMCLYLNKIALYGTPEGRMNLTAPRRKHYVLVDGIIAGEGNGPMDPDPVNAGLVVFGTNPAAVDSACAVLMGYDPHKIPLVRQAFSAREYPIADFGWEDVELLSNIPEWNQRYLPDIPSSSTYHFTPPHGWTGHIERATQHR